MLQPLATLLPEACSWLPLEAICLPSCREYNDPDIEITPAGFPDPNARRKTLEASLPQPVAPTQLPDAYRVAIDQAHTRLRNQPVPEFEEGISIPGGMAQEHTDRVRSLWLAVVTTASDC